MMRFARFGRVALLGCGVALAAFAQAANAETIRVDLPDNPTANAGEEFRFTIYLENNSAPLYSYGVDMRLERGSEDITSWFDVVSSNFAMSRNLIEQGGGELAPSKAYPTGDGSFLMSGSNDSFANVAVAADGVNDALVEVAIDIPAGTEGQTITFSLEDSMTFTQLVHFDDTLFELQNVTFDFEPTGGSIDIQIVPEPASLALLGLGLIGLLRRR